MESISEATRILSLHQVYLQIGKYFVHSFLHPIFVFSLTDFHVHKQKPWSNGLISLGPVNHLLIVSECQWSFSYIFWKLSHIMQLYPYFWFALPYIFFSMIGYCPHASNGHRNLRYLKTLLRLEMLKKTPISHSPGFALNTPNLAYFTPKLFRWLRLRRESLRLQKFSVTNTVLSLPFSQQIQFTIRVTVVNLN